LNTTGLEHYRCHNLLGELEWIAMIDLDASRIQGSSVK